MKYLAIIQARTSSTRLPNKVIMNLAEKPVLSHVISRVKASALVSDIVVATTLSNEDIKIVKLVSNLDVKVYCGSENDVLDRFYQIAKIIQPDNIVRITSDCPVIDPKVIDLVISEYEKNNVDYASNALNPTFPDGLDVEVFSFRSLEKAYFEAKLYSEREHVTPYINKNKHIFKVINIANNIDLSDKRWTLDNKEDFILLSHIFDNLYYKNNLFGMSDILYFLSSKSELENINKHINRNEGLKKSLLKDLND